MRDNEKILNQKDVKKSIFLPVLFAAAAVCLLIGLLIFFGVKDPELFDKIRDLAVTLIVLVFLVINTAAAVLFFILSPKINGARTSLDQILSSADGKVEELADKVIVVLKKILEPFITVKTEKAGVLSILSRKKEEN